MDSRSIREGCAITIHRPLGLVLLSFSSPAQTSCVQNGCSLRALPSPDEEESWAKLQLQNGHYRKRIRDGTDLFAAHTNIYSVHLPKKPMIIANIMVFR